MAAVGTKLRSFGDANGNAEGYMHWCPGCEEHHGIWVQQPNPTTGARWTWDGNVDAPTFSPSVVVDRSGPHRCHYFVIGGNILFLADSWHRLAGQTVPLPLFE